MLPSPVKSHVHPALLHAQKWRGRVGLTLVACLSVLAGMTDAIGFMASGDFVSFMSGNTTRLAVAISNGDLNLVLRLALLVATFIISNALGIVVSRMTSRRTLPLLLCIAALLCASATWPFDNQLPALLGAITAMGMLNAAVEEVNGFPVGLTYVTGALSRFGRGLGRWMLGEQRNGWRVQLIPWTGMFVGAVVGALLEQHLGLKALFASGALSAILAVASLKIPRRWQLAYMPK
ncbi:YoaK family protein [Pseudomonas sp. 10B1]|uniref:YoaK family protein n=1 Tax=unclassified Pseudomonas TaxID=196821 RepID=UPI002AB4F509|nr:MULTISPECIES: YoaK family protein [unclassified Pseudomonas]MDY7559751.1 YoaK family protein [Pseudomonas sp. AB6]MEA9976656.1 YoaK family protein [Pseudomonas sp. RTS4]MEA9993012.1 YoaK family protein [Pseudomonas sp. AA4]MEB0085955.1 YoaK family protein [Pseudomonas sp. RTI1]MEB0125610.1 YoaK family protein [Pseudomonas sp. CCC1.2]